jgi:hypothetical protein
MLREAAGCRLQAARFLGTKQLSSYKLNDLLKISCIQPGLRADDYVKSVK